MAVAAQTTPLPLAAATPTCQQHAPEGASVPAGVATTNGEAVSLPQLDGADDTAQDDSHDALAHCESPLAKDADESEHKDADDSEDDYKSPRMRPIALVITVEDWFLEVDDSWRGMEEIASKEPISKREPAATLNCGAVLWVLGKSAWYRLKVPHASYAATMQAFVDKVSMGDNVCEVVRRSPYSTIHKVIDQLIEARVQQVRFEEALSLPLSRRRCTTSGVPMKWCRRKLLLHWLCRKSTISPSI